MEDDDDDDDDDDDGVVDIGNMGHNGGLNALMGSWAKPATC